MADVQIAQMTAAEARDLTDRINAAAGTLWRLMLESYEREAWRALGYASWREYATAEFSISKSAAYEALDQGRVMRAIMEAAGEEFSARAEIGPRIAREIKGALPAITEEIRARVDAGEAPADAVPAAIESHRPHKVPEPPSPPSAKPAGGDAAPEYDLVRELEAAHAEIEQLQREVTSLSASDRGEEIRRLNQRYVQLEGRLRQEMTTSAAAQKQAQRYGKLLKDIASAVGVEKYGDILPALREVLP